MPAPSYPSYSPISSNSPANNSPGTWQNWQNPQRGPNPDVAQRIAAASPGTGIASSVPWNNTPIDSRDQSASDRVARAIPFEDGAGDYFGNIRRFAGNAVARWQSIPVSIHLPDSSPESWQRSLQACIKKWSKYVPLVAVTSNDAYDIDVKWINHLPPHVFGITRWEGSSARFKVTVFTLRPTFYPADVPETALQPVFSHELGHALGILGHSSNPSDLMFQGDEKSGKKSTAPHMCGFTGRDLNTLKKIYGCQPLPESFVFSEPLEYSLTKR
jgi:hypothetical protein